MPPTAPARAPQTRTRREQGVENMIEATVQLLRTRSPEQITVREIAEASGHHHRFVQAWFGGKVGLFRAAFDRLLEKRADQMADTVGTNASLGPDLVLIVGVMNWLVAVDPTSLDGPRPMPIVDRLVESYREDFGLDPGLARLMALRLVAAAIAGILFRGALGIDEGDVAAIAELERETAQLLAQARTTHD